MGPKVGIGVGVGVVVGVGVGKPFIPIIDLIDTINISFSIAPVPSAKRAECANCARLHCAVGARRSIDAIRCAEGASYALQVRRMRTL